MSIVVTANQDLTQASGTIDYTQLNYVYEGFSDNLLAGIGRTIRLYLEPQKQQNDSVVSNPIRNGAYNPFFNTSVRPAEDGQNRGVKIVDRYVEYTAHIRHGPAELDDISGIGKLEKDEVMTTTVIGSKDHILTCLNALIDDQRYVRKEGPHPFGLIDVKYMMQIWKRIPDNKDGVTR